MSVADVEVAILAVIVLANTILLRRLSERMSAARAGVLHVELRGLTPEQVGELRRMADGGRPMGPWGARR